jgi:hypothetical protein
MLELQNYSSTWFLYGGKVFQDDLPTMLQEQTTMEIEIQDREDD